MLIIQVGRPTLVNSKPLKKVMIVAGIVEAVKGDA
jgi:hypothetical protein